VMPAYPWLFDVVASAPEGATVVPVPAPYAPAEGVVVPNERGEALVAYLLSLKQAPLEAGDEHATAAGGSAANGADGLGAHAGGTR